MRRRQLLGAGLTAAGALLLGTTATAGAADTPITFATLGGTLSISAPSATVTLVMSGPLSVTGATASGSLGTTTVDDSRGVAVHSVTVTMSASAFAKAGAASIPSSAATGYSGPATASGTAVPLPTLTAQSLGGAGSTILTLNSVLGAGGASYNPTVRVAVPASAVTGTYTGTITQTVS